MNQRFIITTFAACIFMFAAIFALTAPASLPRSAAKADAAPAAVMYADCDAVRAAHAAPLRAGQPGYRPALDANMNGIACESVGSAAPLAVANAPSSASDMPQGDAPTQPPVQESTLGTSNPPPPIAERLPPLT
ncbi:excalibur calcium-binding domain-containing protein [Sphingomonas sp. GB1N7]|uniref:excalibur calcium-binding domain-containing protein n=1 Tax=Parasphingomonas caseinilytica TaxID=3096158 RepID=UPI002FCADB0A